MTDFLFARRCLQLALFALLLGGCNARQAATPPDTSTKTPPKPRVTVPPGVPLAKFPRDDLGRVVALKSPAQRVIVIGPGATEMLFAIGAKTQIVGRDSASDFPLEAKKVPVAGDFNGPNLEKSISLRPDLVIVQGESYGTARANEWQSKIGAPVAILSATTVQSVANDIGKVAAWTGKQKNQARILKPFAKFLSRPQINNGTAFFEVGRNPLWTAGRGTLIDDVIRLADLRNVSNVRGYQAFNSETLLVKQPMFYITTYSGDPHTYFYSSQFKRDRKATSADPVLKNLRCVRKNTVVSVPADWVLRPGPRLPQGIQELVTQTQMAFAPYKNGGYENN